MSKNRTMAAKNLKAQKARSEAIFNHFWISASSDLSRQVKRKNRASLNSARSYLTYCNQYAQMKSHN